MTNSSSKYKNQLKRLRALNLQKAKLKWKQESEQFIQEADERVIKYNLKHYGRVEVSQKEISLNEKIKLCGSFYTKSFYCKNCEEHNIYVNSEDEKFEPLLKTSRSIFYCEIRYCDNPDCLVYRYSRMINNLKSIKRLYNLKTLWHFSIGFESIQLEEFQDNFSSYKKRMECVLNSYLKKLRCKGIKIQGLRVLDFSFVRKGILYLHYHFAVIPFKKDQQKRIMSVMQQTRIKMIEHMRKVTPFHLQFYKHASKNAILSYIAIRSIGLYKYDTTENPDYKYKRIGNLKESIKQGLYLPLKDVINEHQYIKHFYNKRHYVTVGGLPYGSTITDNIVSDLPKTCIHHGELTRSDIRVVIEFEKSSIEGVKEH